MFRKFTITVNIVYINNKLDYTGYISANAFNLNHVKNNINILN